MNIVQTEIEMTTQFPRIDYNTGHLLPAGRFLYPTTAQCSRVDTEKRVETNRNMTNEHKLPCTEVSNRPDMGHPYTLIGGYTVRI